MDHGCWPQRRPSRVSEMVRLYRSISGVCLHLGHGIHRWSGQELKWKELVWQWQWECINTLWVPVLLSLFSSTLYTSTGYHSFMDNMSLLYSLSCRFALCLWSESRQIHPTHSVSLNISCGKFLVMFLYTKLINVHRTGFPHCPAGWWHPPSFLREPPELDKERDNLVNYEVLMMHQGRKPQTPSMAVRCYDAFSGVLSVSTFNRCLLVQNLTFAGNTSSRNTLVVKGILRNSKSLGQSNVVLSRPLCLPTSLGISYVLLPLCTNRNWNRSFWKMSKPSIVPTQQNDSSLCTLYRVFYSSEIRVPFDVSGILISVEAMLTWCSYGSTICLVTFIYTLFAIGKNCRVLCAAHQIVRITTQSIPISIAMHPWSDSHSTSGLKHTAMHIGLDSCWF